jgi:hypothetical protein
MSRSNALITMALIAVLALGLWIAAGPLGITLAGAIGLAATFGFYWTSRDGQVPRQLREPDAHQPKHWGWQAASGAFAGLLIVLGFILAA